MGPADGDDPEDAKHEQHEQPQMHPTEGLEPVHDDVGAHPSSMAHERLGQNAVDRFNLVEPINRATRVSYRLRSLRIRWLANLPGEPITQPPGWVPDPHW